ncbi:protein FAM149B1 isoform X2 [Denticeps clupeoides]|uniref:protein FAM149B1 isoform X2 n=1 Tax=Denticeps clupeoides TaxID=299321 RepID=UPI0010A2FE5A|nr:protein FAM149B1 isoform X2 [Denticeps clupeoides]
MISRYSRRPVSHTLEMSSLDHHPPPEDADDDDYLPQPLFHDPQEPLYTYNSSDASGLSGRSGCQTVNSGDTTRSWSGIHSYTDTGISVERSSVFSWAYDEFDKAASQQVQQMFDEIDEELYEGSGGVRLASLQDECQQWATRFPHLRILGTQLLCPTDEGFQWFAGSVKGASCTTPASEDGKNMPSAELCVHGQKAVMCRSYVEVENAGSHTSEQNKVIEAEGLVEEYLAFDCRDLDEEWDCDIASSRDRHCLPPVSPYRCRREAVLDLLFDDVWRELVGWMEELVRRHWEACVSDDERNTGALSPLQTDSQNPFFSLSSFPMMLPRLGQTRVPQLTASLQAQSTKSKGQKRSRRKSKKLKKPATSSRVSVGAPATHPNLNDLIMIHGIPLQQRNVGTLDRVAQECEERMCHRPGSSALASVKPRPHRTLDQSSSSLSRPPQSARRRNPPPRTLLPLAPSLTQSSGAGSMDEVIRGTRLATASDRLTSPMMPLSRNTLLPPISTGDGDHSQTTPHSRHTQRQRGGSASCAHSAVTEEAGSLVPRERFHLLDVFSRPNTTHTYRSDTPYRRSFTILDNSGQGRLGRASVGTDTLDIGVTGISLGGSSSSFVDSFAHHPMGHSPIEDEEEPDALAPPPALLVPISVPSRSTSRGGLTARISRLGL